MEPRPLARSAGFSLIEVLVALVVLAFGLLGVAAIQINALKTNHSAAQRSQATMLANLMLDAMRANDTAARDGRYNLPKSCGIPSATGSLVANDRKYWMEKLHEQLGIGTCGAINCASNGVCTIEIEWNDSRARGNENQTFVLTTRL